MTPGPFALDERADLLPAVRRPIGGWRIAYGPDSDVFRRAGGRRSRRGRRAGHWPGRRGGGRPPLGHGELGELWCRLIVPVNVATFETFKRSGLDLLCDHWSDFPPEYLGWIEECCQLQVPQLMRDEDPHRGSGRDLGCAGRL